MRSIPWMQIADKSHPQGQPIAKVEFTVVDILGTAN